jgi:hypothetical protein
MADEEKDLRTDFFFARPSFWSGGARLFDLWGTFDDYNYSESAEEADSRAIYSDWRIVGQDLRDAWIAHHKDVPQTRSRGGHYVCSKCGCKLLKEKDAPDEKAAIAWGTSLEGASWLKRSKTIRPIHRKKA